MVVEELGQARHEMTLPDLVEVHPLDLSRVVAIGHSAGGHLAAWSATRENPRVPVTGVVSQAGVLDLHRAWEWQLSNGVVRRLLGGTPAQVPERYAAASPGARLPLGVPALLTHGGRDDIVIRNGSTDRGCSASAAPASASRCPAAPGSPRFMARSAAKCIAEVRTAGTCTDSPSVRACSSSARDQSPDMNVSTVCW